VVVVLSMLCGVRGFHLLGRLCHLASAGGHDSRYREPQDS
jgi:hypothetical protein